ncbi:MAG: hypothetical protein GY842_07610 [bacterium]|nr:hypothetical protein [bacterium]
MGDILDALQRLQEAERQLGELRSGEEARRTQVRASQRQLEECQRQLDDRVDSLRRQDVDIQSAELDVASREEIIKKHRVALNQAKTNKEYAAVLTTINTEKADTSKLESRLLELMGVRDTAQEAHDKQATEQVRLGERQARCAANLSEYLERTRERMEELTRERAEIAETLPPTAVATFDRAAERHEGEALAPVTKTSPKRDEYVCGGCNMAITLETVNALFSRDEVVLCKICGRILHRE